MNVIAQLEFELAKHDFTVHHFNHYTMRATPNIILFKFQVYLPHLNLNHSHSITDIQLSIFLLNNFSNLYFSVFIYHPIFMYSSLLSTPFIFFSWALLMPFSTRMWMSVMRYILRLITTAMWLLNVESLKLY